MPPIPSPSESSPSCWLFCTVIDNFGDIGVSWRLARMLNQEMGWTVHLWLDDADALAAIAPELPALPCLHQQIHVRHWPSDGLIDDPAQLPPPAAVIEMFGCNLPEAVQTVIRQTRPLWLNWEYLSAEPWAQRMHGKPSPQADGLQKYFWLMGFTDDSGGLLRERDYLPPAESDNADYRHTLGLPPKTSSEWLIFGYRSAKWPQWWQMWQQAGQPLTLLLAGNTVLDSLKQAGIVPDTALNEPGSLFDSGHLRLIRLPFVAQDNFDRLLSLADGLIVRGEDSFVRAQLSGKPFLWHIYPQDESAHLDKLHAFWHLAADSFSPDFRQAFDILSDDLNDGLNLSDSERLAAWQTLSSHWPQWQQYAQAWQNWLLSQPSAVEKLANFIQDTLK